MDFPFYFQKVMLLWQGSIVEIDYGFFRVFGPYFKGKSLGTFKILIFGLGSFIPPPYNRTNHALTKTTDFCPEVWLNLGIPQSGYGDNKP